MLEFIIYMLKQIHSSTNFLQHKLHTKQSECNVVHDTSNKNETFVSMIHTIPINGNASFRVLFIVQTYTKLCM